MILDSSFETCIKEVSFVDRKIKDYFSPQGSFPEGMYLAEELRKKTYQVPAGYTEDDCRALLGAIVCSDSCMERTQITGSSSPNQLADPRKNEIMRQMLMMMTNSLCCDDFKRQKGISEAYAKGRDILPELFGQLAQNDLTETRKLFSEGVKNMLLLQRSMWKEIQAKPEDYSGYRITEMALDFLEKHPELRDPQILENADMEEIPIFRGKMAFYKEAQEKGRVCYEKTKNGEKLTEDEIAEVILLNQIYAVSRRESDQRRDEVYAEYLKQEKLPGGIPMPIGQRFQELVGCVRNYDNGSIELRQILGPLELEKYKMALEGRINEAVTTQGYGDFTRAVASKYPENREFLLEKVKQSDYFREVLRKEGKDLVNALDTVKDMGVFTREDTLELLKKEGLQENPVTYHAEAIPENRTYAEALEAERRGENIHSEQWEKRFRKMVEAENALINRIKKERTEIIKADFFSDQLKHHLYGSDEKWCKELLRTVDALTELLINGSHCIFLLRPDGGREYLIPKPDGSDLEQLKERCCLEAETNGIFIQAPAGAETKNEVMAVRLDMEIGEPECKLTPLQEYIKMIERESLPEKPSLWKRIFAFLISDYREEVMAYEAAVRDRENAEKLKSVKEAVHRERIEQTAESVRDLDEENNLYVEKMLQAGDEKLDDALEREDRKTSEALRVNRFCENLVKCIEERTGTKPEPETAVLAFINSMQPSGDPMEMYRNRTYTEQVLTGSNILNDEEKTRLVRGYLDLEERVENEERLLAGDKLRCFLNTLMHPETAVTAFGVGASALEMLGEAGIKRALNLDGNTQLTAEIRGIMEYGKICQKSIEICDAAAEKAKTEPDAKLSEEDVLTVLITDCIDRERTVTRNVTLQKNELLTTPLLRRLGKKGMENFREEVRKAVGDDYLREQAAKGSRKFVENHRNTLGVLGEKSLTKQLGGHSRQKANGNLGKVADSLKK